MRNIYDDNYASETKAYIGDLIRTVLVMIFYGGVAGVIGYGIRFGIGMILEYSFYKEEIVEYATLAIVFILHPIFVGFKHIENCGYLDSYDQKFCMKSFFARIGWASAVLMVIPMMMALRINFLIVYIYDLCYYSANGVSELISEGFLHKFDGTTPIGMILGCALTFAIYLLIYIAFYYLGRKHHRQDVEAGIKISVV